jgi:hypothetical protein
LPKLSCMYHTCQLWIFGIFVLKFHPFCARCSRMYKIRGRCS